MRSNRKSRADNKSQVCARCDLIAVKRSTRKFIFCAIVNFNIFSHMSCTSFFLRISALFSSIALPSMRRVQDRRRDGRPWSWSPGDRRFSEDRRRIAGIRATGAYPLPWNGPPPPIFVPPPGARFLPHPRPPLRVRNLSR